ncbi:ATP-binding cassette domain-containing protein [Nocardia sp. R7R-8]|uniref:ATP-binding cassette domain-containing protein n=1 Tax=Nocardia sp. R7R-8 TaxID=3459304 RepID=UPI00403DC29C
MPLLSITGVHKAYGATKALNDAKLHAHRGSIHALVGGNGSGKSTLIKILAGVVSADTGRLALGGEVRDLRSHSAHDAKMLGLHFVHQENSTFPDLSVAENLSVGRGYEVGIAGRIRWSAVRRRAVDVLERFEISASPDTRLGSLSGATQMMVAIARALQDTDETHNGVLVLDEPTASLPTHEVDVLLTALRRYALQGHTILYVTHRLQEILDYANEGTVLKDGNFAGTFDPREVEHDELVTMIMGEPIAPIVARPSRESTIIDSPRNDVVLRVAGVGSPTTDLIVHAGEVVGVAGILGSGRTRLLRQIFGVLPLEGSSLEVGGRRVKPRGPTSAMQHGIAYVPENRPEEAAFKDLSISKNISIAMLPRHTKLWRVSARSERQTASSLVRDLGVKAASEEAPLSSLSGGNQQKVILARWLQRKPRVLLLDEPTQGVDVGARAEIHALIRSAAREGMGVVLVSSDFEELAAASDRVVVLQDGRITAEVRDAPISEAELNELVYSVEEK